jgi:hypothetical protein
MSPSNDGFDNPQDARESHTYPERKLYADSHNVSSEAICTTILEIRSKN